MGEKYYIGVDIGGTKILTALVSARGDVVEYSRIETRVEDGPREIVRRTVETVKGIVRERKVEAMGLGVPGPVIPEKGMVSLAPNLGWKNVAVLDLFAEHIEWPIYLENDALVAAWGENILGAGRNMDNFLFITVSTGIGGGIILNGEIFRGAWGAGGEVGHIILDENGPVCSCGNKGCLEALASGSALTRMGKEALSQRRWPEGRAPENISGALITDWARAGDEVALEIIDRQVNFLSLGIVNLIHLFNPEGVILGGGVMAAKDLLLPRIREKVNQTVLPGFNGRLEICPAELEENAGVLGAAMIARDFAKK